MLLQVHDELVFEAPEDEVEKALPVIRRVMVEAPAPALTLRVPLVVEAQAGGELGGGALNVVLLSHLIPRRSPPVRAVDSGTLLLGRFAVPQDEVIG